MDDFFIASATSDNQFAKIIALFCNNNGIDIHPNIDKHIFDPRKFSGGEYSPKAVVNKIKGKRAYLFANPNPLKTTPQGLFARIIFATDALKRNGAKEVYLVYTDMHYSRQDRGPDDIKEAEAARKESEESGKHVPHKMEGESFSAMVQAKHFQLAGIDKIITMHAHSDTLYKIYGGAALGIDEYDEEWNDEDIGRKLIEKGREKLVVLNPAPVVAHYILNESTIRKKIAGDGSNIVFLVPDFGARKFADSVIQHFYMPNISVIQCKKIRKVPNRAKQVTAEIVDWPEGLKLTGKYVFLVDDGSDTGGTLDAAALTMRSFKYIMDDSTIGHPEGLITYITHPWLNGPGYEYIQKNLADIKDMKEILVTNTWTHIDDYRVPCFKEISSVLRLAKFFYQAILGIQQEIPLEEYFSFNSREELDEKVPLLYSIKRSDIWNLEQRRRDTKPIKMNGIKTFSS